MSTLLGFDFGTEKVGVAVGQRVTRSARPLTRIGPRDWEALDALIAEWQPEALVVGLPLAEDGAEQPLTRRVQRYARALAQRSRLPVYTCDERYSSLAADSALSGCPKPNDNDAEAARIILEQWLSQEATTATQTPPHG
ncbi:Holliday junction resolvase RuvX [Algiphilus sp. NNCM1]|uniref:Holliday junction resolvase RuvX n=1 Tax=Algiphilus sp. TaxID=1872431 RepID=UPI001CA63F15|nr:Holliday junction resolvase RuvX [Algiphilus sp.]MBY8965594.1 Holliday junction resolvase RuvX [Algiphilus acroporae]MCI5061556.1 Holliday junction resolvase RuvX [Algiphilus sp.]MCI5102933.1 Holliday junction resolvase RuvX [Algiphilus sp.]